MSKNKIVDLIVDAASDKILFKLISKDKIYTNEYENCRKNFDKFSVLLMNFLTKKQYSFKKIRNVFINQGPGKYTSIRLQWQLLRLYSSFMVLIIMVLTIKIKLMEIIRKFYNYLGKKN